MHIKNKFIDVIKLEEFADKHGLIMEVCERPLEVGNEGRYYAHFENIEIKDGSVLVSAYGNGATPEQAINNYKKEICLKTIVINAYGNNRKEINVPRII